MAWLALLLAGLCETLGVAMINQMRVNRNWKPVAGFVAGFGASLWLLGYALQTLPMGTAYAIWTGIGVVGGTLVGMIFYGESKDWKRLVCIAMVLGAAVGLKWIS